MENEIWKSIAGYNNDYCVSSLGNVKSLKFNKQKLLKKCIHKNGYEFVNLYLNGKSRYCNVHQLVATAFMGYVSDGTLSVVVDHKDNNQSNNLLSNLQLITQRENTSKDKTGTSVYTGISFDKTKNNWQAQIYLNKKVIKIGNFISEIEAKKAYDKYLIK